MAKLKPRVIVTTDMEVDDMNSVIHLALYLNKLDVAAMIYTSSQYHFQGDGLNTLADVTPHWRTKGVHSYEGEPIQGPDPEAGKLMKYRPFPERWIERLWSCEYRLAWPTLEANAKAAGEPRFPTPEEMIERTYVGNVDFEGDVRFDTPGSNVIKQAILDDDSRTLWLLSWGGMNTIVRALMSIAEDWQRTPAWDDIRYKIYQKVRVMGVMKGVGQDNSWLDYGRPLFPELQLMRVPFSYGGYVDAKAAQEDSIDLFRAPWPEENLTRGNGPLMERYMLYGDGKHYEGEPDRFQFGEHATLDWGIPGMGKLVFEPGDFMAEGDSMTYIPLIPFGLRGADNHIFDTVLGRMFSDNDPNALGLEGMFAEGVKPPVGNPNPFLRAYQEDFAARAQWAAHRPIECNHAPIVSEVSPDAHATPGEAVALHATVTDPDGDAVRARWCLYADDGSVAWEAEGAEATFVVPTDAQAGDYYVLTLVAKDEADRPMTRYAQVALTVAG